MHEVDVTVVGNVATPVDYRTSDAGYPTVRFRLAATVRRFDRARGDWTDAHTSFYTVWAWRALATNVSSSVTLGEPLIVRGQLRVRETEREGRTYTSAELLASAVGHDLARGTSAFARVSRAIPGLTRGTSAGHGESPVGVVGAPGASRTPSGPEARLPHQRPPS